MRKAGTLASALLSGVVRGEYSGRDPNAARDLFAVYAHYDAYGIVHRYVVEQLAALARAGLRVIFVTHSPVLPNFDDVRVHTATMLHRRNLGHDFGAYGCGLRWIRQHAQAPSAVLLMNDSCYGFFSSIEGLERNVAAGAADLWGLTESYEHHYHLQSYFLLISRKLFTAPAFWAFWNRLPLHRSREQVVQKQEIELSQAMLRAGFRLAAKADYRQASETWLRNYRPKIGTTRSEKAFLDLVENSLVTMKPLNPTHSLWEVLLRDYHVPLVKRDLLTKNPLAVPGIQTLASIVAEQGGDISATLEHLRFRTTRDGILPIL